MDPEIYPALMTSEIPAPLLSGEAAEGIPEPDLPRVLRESLLVRRANRRTLLLAAVFSGIALLELALDLGLPGKETLVVYRDPDHRVLLRGLR
jgi:hypothetical protein